MRYPEASTEPLDIIRLNECEGGRSLTMKRSQALWNEIERLREKVERYETTLNIIAGSADLLMATQAKGALANIGAKIT